VVASRTVLAALIVGTGVTAVAGFVPSRKAAKVAPVAAMQDGVIGSSGYGSKERIMVCLGVLTAGVALLFTGLFAGLSNAVTVVGLGAVTVILGVSVLGRTIALPLSSALGAPLPRLRGVSGELARENSMRNPKRTAATASALMVCVAVVGLMNIMASSTRASITSILNRAFTGDFVADPGGGVMGGVDHSLVQRVGQLPEVAAATSVRVTSAKVNGKVEGVLGVDPASLPAILNVRPKQGSMQDLGINSIAVFDQVAKNNHLALGDPVQVVFKDTGVTTLRVALIYGENQPAGNYLVGMTAFEAHVSNHLDYGVYIKKAPGVSKAAALTAIKTVTKDYPGVTVMDQSAFKASIAKPFNQLLGLVYALLVLAVVIAVLGIANTLALSIFERTRELGLLRAVGMTRSQLRSTIRWESVIIALQGTLIGLVVGVFFGWALLRALGKTTGTLVFSIPYRTLMGVVVFGALLGVIAAIMPSRRAAKLDVLKAVVSE
jgi:putative ABC transport system permease protein